MTLFSEPRDVTAHLRHQEMKHVTGAYDHFAPKMNGWRHERQIVEMSTRVARSQVTFGKAKFLKWMQHGMARFIGAG